MEQTSQDLSTQNTETVTSASAPLESEEDKEDLEHGFGDLLRRLENYTPIVPDSLALQYLHQTGFETVDPRIVRIISVLSQKFISDIANDSLQHCKTRTNNSQQSSGHNSNKDKKLNKDRKYTLAMEDLAPALADHGITVRKPHYFV